MVPVALEPTREQAWETLCEYTKGEALRRHALAVEASTAFYARKLGEDEEQWRVAALQPISRELGLRTADDA